MPALLCAWARAALLSTASHNMPFMLMELRGSRITHYAQHTAHLTCARASCTHYALSATHTCAHAPVQVPVTNLYPGAHSHV